MYDIIVIGSTTLDLFFIGDSFTRKGDRYELAVGGKYVADNFIQRIGGGGANVSVGLARQGFSVAFWGILDDSLVGQHMRQVLTKEEIDTVLLENRKNSLSISAILLSTSGEKTVITYHAEKSKREYDQKVENILQRNKWLVLGNSPGNTKEEKVLWITKAKNKGMLIFTQLSALECKEGIDQIAQISNLSDWIILNAHELADLVGLKYEELNLNERNFEQVLNIKGLIVTDGKNGAFAYKDMKRFYQRAIDPPRILDTSGAGDAFASGFLGELIRTNDVGKSLFFASQNAASVISKIGAQDGLLNR